MSGSGRDKWEVSSHLLVISNQRFHSLESGYWLMAVSYWLLAEYSHDCNQPMAFQFHHDFRCPTKMLVIDLIPTFKVMRNFRELHIWNEGMAVDAYKIVQLLPKEEEYGLKSQIKRASVSIVSNIAEGCSRASQKEFKHFLEISLGSCFEVETDTLLAEKLGILPMGLIDNFIVSLHTLQKQINALITKLKSS